MSTPDWEPAIEPALRDLAGRIAAAFDVPAWVVGLEPPPPAPTGIALVRARIARRIGQGGWRLGNTVSDAGTWLARSGHRITAHGHRLDRAGSRVIDAGDHLADRIAGPRP